MRNVSLNDSKQQHKKTLGIYLEIPNEDRQNRLADTIYMYYTT